MPLQNATHDRGITLPPQSGAMDRWHTSPTPESGEQHEFSEFYPVLLDNWFNASTRVPTEVPTSALNEFIAFELSLVPEVEFVFTAFRNDVFYAWVIVDKFEEEVRGRIYERERAIIDEFQMFEFDFYIIARLGRDVGDLVSEEINLAYQKGA